MTLTARKIVDSSSNAPYFILTDVQEDDEDFEESQMDISITNGLQYWRKHGTLPHRSCSDKCCYSFNGALLQPHCCIASDTLLHRAEMVS